MWTMRHSQRPIKKSNAFSHLASTFQLSPIVTFSSEVCTESPGPLAVGALQGLMTRMDHVTQLPLTCVHFLREFIFLSLLSTTLLVLDRYPILLLKFADHVNPFMCLLPLFLSLKLRSSTDVHGWFELATLDRASLVSFLPRTSETVRDEDACVAVAGGFGHAGGRVDVNWWTALLSILLSGNRTIVCDVQCGGWWADGMVEQASSTRGEQTRERLKTPNQTINRWSGNSLDTSWPTLPGWNALSEDQLRVV